MWVQRDYGDRVDRSHARFKYTIDDKGLDWIKAEIEARARLRASSRRGPSRSIPMAMPLGWVEGADGRLHYTLFIENGRIRQHTRTPADGWPARHRGGAPQGTFRITPNQNLDHRRHRARSSARPSRR